MTQECRALQAHSTHTQQVHREGQATVGPGDRIFEGNPVGEGTTRRGTATPVHRPQRPAGSTHSSTRGLRPPEQLAREEQDGLHRARELRGPDDQGEGLGGEGWGDGCGLLLRGSGGRGAGAGSSGAHPRTPLCCRVGPLEKTSRGCRWCLGPVDARCQATLLVVTALWPFPRGLFCWGREGGYYEPEPKDRTQESMLGASDCICWCIGLV